MGAYQITQGPIVKPQKVVVYGPEGIGKTTFASCFPSPLFIDTEDGSAGFDVRRLPAPTSWTMLLEEITYIRDFPAECGGTLVLDTADWAESLCISHVCKKNGWSGIEDPGYGKGYTYVKEEFGKLLNLLSEVVECGLNVCVTAHAVIVKYEQPDEMGAYDRWELKLSRKQTAPLLKEWADALLFANYKTVVVTGSNKKAKAQGGKNRVIYTTHAATWDAKNRWGLPDEVPMDFAQIAPYIPVPQFAPPQAITQVEPVPETATAPTSSAPQQPVQVEPEPEPVEVLPAYMYPIADLMKHDGVTDAQVRWAMAAKGYVTEDTPLTAYAEDMAGWLESVWPQMVEFIKENYNK